MIREDAISPLTIPPSDVYPLFQLLLPTERTRTPACPRSRACARSHVHVRTSAATQRGVRVGIVDDDRGAIAALGLSVSEAGARACCVADRICALPVVWARCITYLAGNDASLAY